MSEILSSSVYFGVGISLLAYFIGDTLNKKIKIAFLNPLLIAILLVIGVLLVFKIEYSVYENGAKYLTYLLTPATVCLAIPLYQQISLLKKNIWAILFGILSGVISGLCSILALALVFRLEHVYYVSLLPKSITTAIGIGVSSELGGISTITVSVIMVTGVLGNIIAPTVCKMFSIKEPIAVGLAIGTSSHAAGTAKALELGEIQGAMSSLAVVVAGLLTVGLASVFANII